MHKLLICLILTLGATISAAAGEIFVVGTIAIDTPWARASIGKTRPTAAYFTIRNNGTDSDRLIKVTNPNAAMTSIHATTMKDGAMSMSPAGPLEILPGQTITLKPGGLHLMIMKLSAPLKEGANTKLELTFERAGKITVLTPVFGPGAREPK